MNTTSTDRPRLSHFRQAMLSLYWFAMSVQWTAILITTLPNQAYTIGGDAVKGNVPCPGPGDLQGQQAGTGDAQKAGRCHGCSSAGAGGGVRLASLPGLRRPGGQPDH